MHAEIAVIRIRPAVMDLPGAVIADQNAASKYALFLESPNGLRKLDHSEVFAQSWKFRDDQIREWRAGSRVCAELLVPHFITPDHLIGAYVLDSTAKIRFEATGVELPCIINPSIFLR